MSAYTMQAIPQAVHMQAPPKRKRSFSPDLDEEVSFDAIKHVRTLPPSVQGPNGFAFPINMPELIHDQSTTASDSDAIMDHDGDFDMDPPSPAHANYSYAPSGSGGFFFGPGAEEDEMSDGSEKGYPNLDIYPPIQQGFPFNASASASAPVSPAVESPWCAQPFASNLPAPASPGLGLLQPQMSAPLGEDATAVERARSAHGPHCTSIPKLKMSDYPDAAGERSLWAYCPDCGAMERAT